MKIINPDTLARLKVDHKRATLISLEFTPFPVYLTNTPFNIVYNGNTYLANGQFLQMGSLSQTLDIRVGSTSIVFDATDPSFVAILRGQSQNSRKVNISLAILNDDYTVAGDVIVMQRMIIDGAAKVEDNPSQGKATITQKISSDFANWSQKAGRRTTPASQQRYFPNDTGFDYAAYADNDIKWGRK
ncbi:MAG: hypothetical protein ACJAUY_000674 [Cognaticolwellia sp.]